MTDQVVAVIDLKAFYAVVECVERQLDPFVTPLVVADKSRGSGTIVLSVSPLLKSQGVPSRCRVFELPKRDDILFATPRMSLYLKKSADVISIMLDYIGEDDIHVYSIDEAFLNLGPYLKLYRCTPRKLVERIIKAIHQKLGLYATAGIGPNNFIAKSALDIEAKKRSDGIAEWTLEDIKTKLWPLTPLSKMWGVSSRLELRLNNLGISSIGELAAFPKEILNAYFGVMGEQLWQHANGMDESHIREKYTPQNPSLTMGQVLMRDYTIDEIPIVISDMVDDLCIRLRLEGKLTGVVSLFIGYRDPGGFARQMALQRPSDDNEILKDAFLTLFNRHIEHGRFVRNVGLAFSKLQPLLYEQLDIFIDPLEQDKKRRLQTALDEIKFRFGRDAILRATALLKSSTTIERHKLIGGHRK
ncbi:MAG TPA: damage repair protein [Firmicutes bacterium]|jgi:DNA polymerase V|nr:damage repair protein [Bacillota bacterium]